MSVVLEVSTGIKTIWALRVEMTILDGMSALIFRQDKRKLEKR